MTGGGSRIGTGVPKLDSTTSKALRTLPGAMLSLKTTTIGEPGWASASEGAKELTVGSLGRIQLPWPGTDAPRRFDVELESDIGDAPAASGAVSWSERGFTAGYAERRSGDPTSSSGAELEGEYRQHSATFGSSWVGSRSLFRVGARVDTLEDADRLASSADPSRTRVPEESLARISFEIDTPGAVDRSIVGWLGASTREVERLESSGDGLRSATDASDLGVRLVWQGESRRASWLAGADARHRFDVATELSALGDGTPLAPTDRFPLASGRQSSAAMFGSFRIPAGPRFQLEAGGRLEPIWTAADALGERRSEASWASAANVSLTADASRAGRFVLQLATGFREPTISERYYRGVTGRGFVIENPALDAERSRHLDLVWHRETSRLQLEASAFLVRIEDVVVRELLGEGTGPAGADLFRFDNVGEATIRGVELAASGSLGGGHTFTVSAHALRGEDGDARPLEGIPAHGVFLGWRHNSAGGRGFRVDLELRDDDRRAAPGEQETPGFARVDAGASFPLSAAALLELSVANVLDQSYLSSSRGGAPEAPGATLRIALRFAIGG